VTLKHQSERVIELTGILDNETAAKVAGAIQGLAPSIRVVIDLHEVREVQDAALRLLLERLVLSGRLFHLKGLGSHQLKLLHYLRLPEDSIGSRSLDERLPSV